MSSVPNLTVIVNRPYRPSSAGSRSLASTKIKTNLLPVTDPRNATLVARSAIIFSIFPCGVHRGVRLADSGDAIKLPDFFDREEMFRLFMDSRLLT